MLDFHYMKKRLKRYKGYEETRVAVFVVALIFRIMKIILLYGDIHIYNFLLTNVMINWYLTGWHVILGSLRLSNKETV